MIYKSIVAFLLFLAIMLGLAGAINAYFSAQPHQAKRS